MNDAGAPPQEPAKPGLLEALDGLPDTELQELVRRAQEILKGRKLERRREAVREIQRLAKEHGLQVEVGGEKRRPGRPRKRKDGAIPQG